MRSQSFLGFPCGKLRATRIPSLFFSELLPQIDDLGELKATLFCFWRISHRAQVPFVHLSELSSDEGLTSAFGGNDPLTALKDGLERATRRGTFIHVVAERKGNREDLYFLNSETGRATVNQLNQGDWSVLDSELPDAAQVEGERSNIFLLYEQNLGTLQPLIAEELREAEGLYPMSWIEQAFREAARMNKRHWRYVNAILERWLREGKDDATIRRSKIPDPEEYISGENADFIEY